MMIDKRNNFESAPIKFELQFTKTLPAVWIDTEGHSHPNKFINICNFIHNLKYDEYWWDLIKNTEIVSQEPRIWRQSLSLYKRGSFELPLTQIVKLLTLEPGLMVTRGEPAPPVGVKINIPLAYTAEYRITPLDLQQGFEFTLTGEIEINLAAQFLASMPEIVRKALSSSAENFFRWVITDAADKNMQNLYQLIHNGSYLTIMNQSEAES